MRFEASLSLFREGLGEGIPDPAFAFTDSAGTAPETVFSAEASARCGRTITQAIWPTLLQALFFQEKSIFHANAQGVFPKSIPQEGHHAYAQSKLIVHLRLPLCGGDTVLSGELDRLAVLVRVKPFEKLAWMLLDHLCQGNRISLVGIRWCLRMIQLSAGSQAHPPCCLKDHLGLVEHDCNCDSGVPVHILQSSAVKIGGASDGRREHKAVCGTHQVRFEFTRIHRAKQRGRKQLPLSLSPATPSMAADACAGTISMFAGLASRETVR